jgi:NAD(P)H-hydrate epimerase
MMENAGRCLAILARELFLKGSPIGKHVIVLAGSGGNGGGALVAARRLHNWGASVTVMMAQSAKDMTLVASQQLDILDHMAVDIRTEFDTIPDKVDDVIIDGLIGYSLRGAPYDITRELIDWANQQSSPVLALDAPSGIDTASGIVFDPAITAEATLTLALPKQGLRTPAAIDHVGELYLADLSVPPSLYAAPALGLDVGPIYASGDLVRKSMTQSLL